MGENKFSRVLALYRNVYIFEPSTNDTFFQSIADVQWMDGEPPDAHTQRRILTDAWNFLVLDEEKLNEDDINKMIDEGLED